MRTRDEALAYQRGYNAAKANKWPSHKPPLPPDPLCRKLIDALRTLRDATDSACATFDEGDEFCERLDPAIQQADEALSELTAWLADRK